MLGIFLDQRLATDLYVNCCILDRMVVFVVFTNEVEAPFGLFS